MSTIIAPPPTDVFRVKRWEDYVGQAKLKRRLSVAVAASHERGDRVVEPILLTGPPGCGKTSLGAIIAEQMMRPFQSFIMPIDERVLVQFVTQTVGVVLLDELHRASKRQQEELLTLLSDNYVQLKNGRIIENPYLTIIGASTEQDKIIKPLVDRFSITPQFEPYSDDEMAEIALGMAQRVDISITEDLAAGLGRASGGVPRHMKKLLSATRDLNLIGEEATLETVLELCHITQDGLTEQHVQYLLILGNTVQAMGLSAIADHMSVGQQVVRDLERLLRQKDIIEYTKGGRLLTVEGYTRVRQLETND